MKTRLLKGHTLSQTHQVRIRSMCPLDMLASRQKRRGNDTNQTDLRGRFGGLCQGYEGRALLAGANRLMGPD